MRQAAESDETIKATVDAYNAKIDAKEKMSKNEIFYFGTLDAGSDGTWSAEIPMTGTDRKDITLISSGGDTDFINYASVEYRKNIIPVKIYSSHKIDGEFLKENNAVQASLDEIFSGCKVVSLHSAMTEKTRGMIGKKHFDLLQRGALFVNTARGDIVREDEMIAALKENRFCAVLDVFSREPLDEKSELRTLENVYCIPHMGGSTLDRRPYITKRLAENILKLENGGEAELEIKDDAAKRMTKQ